MCCFVLFVVESDVLLCVMSCCFVMLWNRMCWFCDAVLLCDVCYGIGCVGLCDAVLFGIVSAGL